MSRSQITPVKSWLPVFSGFSYNCWDPEREVTEYWREYCQGEFSWKFWNNQAYMLDVAEDCMEQIHAWLPEAAGIASIKFEAVQSPKEYNFENDSINVVYQVALPKFWRWFRGILFKHGLEWDAYLLRYRSRDGFVSFYPWRAEDWADWTLNYTSFRGSHGRLQTPNHILGSLLEFWFELQTKRLSPGHQDVELTLWELVNTHLDIRKYLTVPESAIA